MKASKVYKGMGFFEREAKLNLVLWILVPLVGVLAAIVMLLFTQEPSKSLQISQTSILKTELAGLNLDSHDQDVSRNISHSDFRFIGICDFACYPPGIQSEDLEYAKVYGVRIIQGTTDALESEEHLELQEAATGYAETYNRFLLEYLKKRVTE
jgi:hypothetical protein